MPFVPDTFAAVLSRLRDLAGGLRHWRDLVRLTPHEQSTEEGRAAERHRRVFLSAVANGAARGTGLLSMLITVPLTVHYLGAERYGMWMTISSITAILAFADFGLGSGLMTCLSHTHGTGDQRHAKELISTAFFTLLLFILAVATLTAVVAPLLPWPRLFNVHSPEAMAEAAPAALTFLAINLVLVPLSVAEEVRTGHQSAFSHSLWIGAGNVVGLVAVLIAIWLRAGLPALVASLLSGSVLASVGSFVSLFWFERPALRPSLRNVARSRGGELFHASVLFLVLDIAVLLAQGSDNFILSQLRGADTVATYSIAMRLFALAPFALVLLTNPLWPAYGEAIARGDAGWVRKTLGRSLVLVALVSGSASVFLLFGARPIISLWVGPALAPPLSLVAGLSLLTLMQALGHTVGMLLNAAKVVRFQVITASLMAVTAVILKIVLTRAWGVSGVAWSTLLAYVPLTLLPLGWLMPRLLRQISRRTGTSPAPSVPLERDIP